jgi:hypothetical protein
MDPSTSNEKLGQEQVITQYAASSEEVGNQLKGWIGDYVRSFSLCLTFGLITNLFPGLHVLDNTKYLAPQS